MTELLWLFAGLICGAGVVFLWTKARMSSLQTLLQVREEEMEKRRSEMEESVNGSRRISRNAKNAWRTIWQRCRNGARR